MGSFRTRSVSVLLHGDYKEIKRDDVGNYEGSCI